MISTILFPFEHLIQTENQWDMTLSKSIRLPWLTGTSALTRCFVHTVVNGHQPSTEGGGAGFGSTRGSIKERAGSHDLPASHTRRGARDPAHACCNPLKRHAHGMLALAR
jgi:hypothetical protein